MENTEVMAVENAVEETAEDIVEVAAKHSNGNMKYVALGSIATLAVIGAVKYGKRVIGWIGSKVKKTKNDIEVSCDEIAVDNEG